MGAAWAWDGRGESLVIVRERLSSPSRADRCDWCIYQAEVQAPTPVAQQPVVEPEPAPEPEMIPSDVNSQALVSAINEMMAALNGVHLSVGEKKMLGDVTKVRRGRRAGTGGHRKGGV